MMNKTTLGFALLFFLNFASFAQLKSGVINYEVKAVASSDDMQSSRTASMMNNAEMRYFFDVNFSSFEFKVPGLMNFTNAINIETGDVLSTVDLAGKKVANKSSLKEFDDQSNEKIISADESSETKNIIGFECFKTIVTFNDGSKQVFWCTSAIEFNMAGQRFLSSKLPGVPLEFNVEAKGVTTTFTALTIGELLESDKEVFSTEIPAGVNTVPLSQIRSFF